MRRVLPLVAAFVMMFCACAQAAFSPTLDEWMGAPEGVELRATMSLKTYAPLGERSLSTLNAWLKDTELFVAYRALADGEDALMRLTMDGAPMIDVGLMRRPKHTITAFGRADGAYQAYLTGEGRQDALSLLTGDARGGVSPDALIKAFLAAQPTLYTLLEGVVTPKTVKSSTSIKNSRASSQYIDYRLTADQMNATWAGIIDAMLPAFDKAMLAAPEALREARALLARLEFSGECRFKRMLDKAGEDVGLQFTGIAADGEDKRKVTVFGGYTEGEGMYVSLALPAVKGKNNFKLTVSFKLTQGKSINKLVTDITYNNVYDGRTTTASLSSTLNNKTTDGEVITGKVTLTVTKDKVKTVYTLTPELTAQNGELTGVVAFTRKTAGDTDRAGEMMLTLSRAETPVDLSAGIAQTLDFTSMSDEAAISSLATEKGLLLANLVRLIATLPEEQRTLLTHELRTDAWMNAPSVSAPESTRNIVTEEE